MDLRILQNKLDHHMHELLRGASVAFGLKVLAAGLAFGLNVVLARLLGADGSGIFFLASTVVLIVAAFGRIGMENVLIRFVASNVVDNKPCKILGVYQKAMLYSFIVGLIASTLLYITAPWMSQAVFNKPELAQPLTIMSIAIVPLALLILHSHALQGLKKIAASISVQSIYVPLLTSIIAIIFVPAYGIESVVFGYVLATIVTLLIGRWFWVRATSLFKGYSAEYSREELLSTSIPMFGVVMMNMVIAWSPMLFLGVWESSENVGIYAAANRTAILISFVLIAVNSIAAPKFAELYQQGDMKALGSLARNSSRLMVIFSLPVLLLFVLVPEWVLSIFGEEFKQGDVVLIILAIGQFVNVTTGSVGYLLMMSGHEKLMRNNLVFNALIGGGLSLLLIPHYGITGAAMGAAIVLSMQNLIAMYLVWVKLNIISFPLVNIMSLKKEC